MIVYLAGSSSPVKVFEEVNFNFNMLESFWYIQNRNSKNIPSKFNRYILDSGAFTFIMDKKKDAKVKVDIDYFTDAYIDHINSFEIDLFFEMDIDVLVGYDKVKSLRKRIESKTGKRSIPVFHLSRGLEDWKNTISEYDYASIGIAGKDVAWGDFKAFKHFVNDARNHNCKIHGLGITGMKSLEEVAFYSVDSSSWTAGNRFGAIDYFDGRTIKKISNLSDYRIKDHYTLMTHNLKQWIKFSEYMSNKLVKPKFIEND